MEVPVFHLTSSGLNILFNYYTVHTSSETTAHKLDSSQTDELANFSLALLLCHMLRFHRISESLIMRGVVLHR